MSNSEHIENSIAIIGMSGRFPGANNIEKFWDNLKNGVESITFFSDQELLDAGVDPEELKDPNYVKAFGFMDGIGAFDASFFGMSPIEAKITDPQQRLFLECCWEALESAGYSSTTYAGAIGVCGGAGTLDTYWNHNLYSNRELRRTIGDFLIGLGNSPDSVCTRVAYKLDLKGPAVSVQTACSTSLVSVVMGCQSLLDFQCDMVLAGGVSIKIPQTAGYLYQEGMIYSPDGHCRAFDVNARGTIGGSGAGIVLLKRLQEAIDDGDTIHAVIRGAAINNDGAEKVGFTAPSLAGQANVIREALELADVNPRTIGYVEAHGTGTPMGDPIEIAALTQAYREKTDDREYCAISSAKTNIGHLDSASGVTGLIKAVMSLKNRQIAPLLHFKKPNPNLNLESSPFYINTELSDWPRKDNTPLRAAVSSFGIGGTNAHVILEEAPNRAKDLAPSRPAQVLLLSAKTETALDAMTENLSKHIAKHPEQSLADIAYTTQVGRKKFDYRRIVACHSHEDASAVLATKDSHRLFSHRSESEKDPSIVFMFSGQGSQYPDMGRELYETERVFREEVDCCSETLRPLLNLDLREILYPTDEGSREHAAEQLAQTQYTQPALFVIEYALTKLWMSWGIQPAALIGHSIGEYTAACLAGVMSLEDALTLVAKRGALMQSMEPGVMLAIPLSEAELRPLLIDDVDLAVINMPSQTVVAGTADSIEAMQKQLQGKGIEAQVLQTSHAFHSRMMEPMLAEFEKEVGKIKLNAPSTPFISNVSGGWIKDSEAVDPQYWCKHIRQTVCFANGLGKLLQDSNHIFLEVGPGRTLSTFVTRHPEATNRMVLTTLHHSKDVQSDSAFVLTTLGRLWLHGADVDWQAFHAEETCQRVPLPTYPFERKRHWVDVPQHERKESLVDETSFTKETFESVSDSMLAQALPGICEFRNKEYKEKYELARRLSVGYMNLALVKLGASEKLNGRYSAEELIRDFNILPFYHQWVPRCLHALTEYGYLSWREKDSANFLPVTGEEMAALQEKTERAWGGGQAVPYLIKNCGHKLDGILTGRENPRELIFTGEAFKHLQHEYKGTPESIYLSSICREGMRSFVEKLPANKSLKILEIGAGTGALTRKLLPDLPSDKTKYVFTDIGQSFLNEAKREFSAYPYIEYQLLNIEENPEKQGFYTGSFDVVIAAQVLHATKNLAKTMEHIYTLLAPGGLLLLWEVTCSCEPIFDASFPILQPFESTDEIRNERYPFSFLDRNGWKQNLKKYGFDEFSSFPDSDELGSNIIIARKGSLKNDNTVSLLPNKNKPHVDSSMKTPLREWFYVPKWELQPLSPDKQRDSFVGEVCLVFGNEDEFELNLIATLKKMKMNVFRVHAGKEYSVNEKEQLFCLNPEQSENYSALFDYLADQNQLPSRMIHLWNVLDFPVISKDIKKQLTAFDMEQSRGFYSLMYLAQELGRQKIQRNVDISVISSCMQKVLGRDILCPQKATLIGPARVIPQEYPNIKCRSIDLESSSGKKEIVDSLIKDMFSGANNLWAAYRQGKRYVKGYEQETLREAENETPTLRTRGVYLITGGLGGIGRTIAEHLATTVNARLILTTHSFFPEKSDWEKWLAEHVEEDRVSMRIKMIQVFESFGAQVCVMEADAGNYTDMRGVVRDGEKIFGQINGIIHSAGAMPGGIIQGKSRDDVERMFGPKIIGALILDSVLEQDDMDFVIYCSSLSSVLGGLGMMDYAAANAFQDAFAESRSNICSVNWDTWREAGMAAEQIQCEVAETPLPSQRKYKRIEHPLFDECRVETSDQEVYVSRLSEENHWVVAEHIVSGRPTLPGTAYLEMARAAFECFVQKSNMAIEFQNVYLLAPLIIPENFSVEVHTVLSRQKGGAVEFIISTEDEFGQRVEHARGGVEEMVPVNLERQLEIKAELTSCQKKVPVRVQEGISFGPHWMDLKQDIRFGKGRSVARISLPDSYLGELSTYPLHPALLDAATGFVAACMDQTYLPFCYSSIRVYGALSSNVVSVGYFREEDDSLLVDLQVADDRGLVLLEIEGFVLREVDLSGAAMSVDQVRNFSLTVVTPGALDSVALQPAERRLPGFGEVEIEVCAVALNFKEVLFALGVLPVPVGGDSLVRLGLECAGRISAIGQGVSDYKVGDEVLHFADLDGGCFGAFKIASTDSIYLKPDDLSLAAAATVPTAYLTACYALCKIGQLREKESVLIHAAAGGVGQAAVQVAQMVGAEIFATAGSEEKREFLRKQGIQHVMDSRTLDFADEIMAQTNGQGVDVVLNSLGGEFLDKSLEVTARYGRFLELGKRDVFEEGRVLDLRPFRKALTFSVLDLGSDSPYCREVFEETLAHFKSGKLRSLPYKTFAVEKAFEAFAFMAGAKHIGRVVLTMDNKDAILAGLASTEKTPIATHNMGHETANSQKDRGDVNIRQAYLNEGLLSGEGIDVFKRVLGCGLSQILVSTRSLQPRIENDEVGESLRNVRQTKLLASASEKSMSPERKIDPAEVAQEEWNQSIVIIWKKFLGVEEIRPDDNFFDLGGDSLMAVQLVAELQRETGSEVSAQTLLQNPTISSLCKAMDLSEISDSNAVFLRETLIVSPNRDLSSTIEKKIVDIWKKFLGVEQITEDSNFFDLGGDSLMAVQLVAELRREMDIEISAQTLLQYPTISALCDTIYSQSKPVVFSEPEIMPSTVICLQKGSSHKSPIYLIPGVGGTAYGFRDFADCLDDSRSVYLFQSKGLNGDAEPLDRVEDMAAQQIADLRLIQAEGPYVFGGHSLGGLVAFEMVRQLKAVGQEIQLLFIMDAPLPQLYHQQGPEGDLRMLMYALGLKPDVELPDTADNFIQTNSIEDRIRFFFERSDRVNYSGTVDEFICDMQFHCQVIQKQIEALKAYRVKYHHEEALFFQPEEPSYIAGGHLQGWDQVISKLRVHHVAGNHKTMNQKPNVQKIVEVVERRLFELKF